MENDESMTNLSRRELEEKVRELAIENAHLIQAVIKLGAQNIDLSLRMAGVTRNNANARIVEEELLAIKNKDRRLKTACPKCGKYHLDPNNIMCEKWTV